MAFAVSLVYMRPTMITFLYRQLATATLWSPLVYGSGVPKRGGLGFKPTPSRNSEGPPKSCQTQPDL